MLLLTALPALLGGGCGGNAPATPVPRDPDVAPDSAAVVFRVTVPPSTPPGDPIRISGNHARLGAWNGVGIRLEPAPDGSYRGRTVMPRGYSVEYKVTRGSWDTVEKGPEGQEIGNRRHVAGEGDTARAEVVAWRDQVEGPPPSTVTGDVRYHRGVTSAYLEAARDVAVYLPPEYDAAPGARYPVLYMHDGQNVFDAATSFAGEWGADEAAETLISEGAIPPLIIVGVANAGSARIDEYTPVPSGGRGGRADDYGRFLIEELKPFIDATYRTVPGREATGLAGSSLGGLVTLYLGLSHPEVFSRLGVVSPSVWWADRWILEFVAAAPRPETRIWLDMGTAEAGDPERAAEHVEGARALRDALTARGWELGEDLHHLEAQGAAHNETAWRERFPEILVWLYPGR